MGAVTLAEYHADVLAREQARREAAWITGSAYHRREHERLWAWARWLGLALALCLGASSAPASAQERADDALTLARICAHEAGWDGFADCAAIYAVLRRNADIRGVSFRRMAYAYSGRALRGETSRRYFAELNEEGTRPESWPGVRWVRRGDALVSESGPSWSRYRPRWLALLDFARAVVAGEVASECAEPPDDWGGRVDRRRAARLGLIEVECGETRNDFYARPSRREPLPSNP